MGYTECISEFIIPYIRPCIIKMTHRKNGNIIMDIPIVRCDGLSALMLGDAFPNEIEAYLRGKGYSEENKLAVDFVKVSHHGSRNNISNTLLDIIDCVNYLISPLDSNLLYKSLPSIPSASFEIFPYNDGHTPISRMAIKQTCFS